MQNATLRVTVDPKTGCITSLYDRLSKFESIAPNQCGNMLQAFVDDAPVEDAWNIVAGYDRSETELTMADSVEVVDKGPLRATVRVTRRWSKSKFIQDITLYAGLPRVDIFNTVDWHETHVLLKASFPLPFISQVATYEIPFGSIQRPTTRTNTVDSAKFEVPALRWADLGDERHGFSLINEAKYGYDAKGSELRISLLRSSVYPDPDADRGVQEFSYSLYPHTGTWKQANTILRAYEFNYKLLARQISAHTGALPSSHSFVSVHPNNLVLTAMKKSEDGDALVLRFYEWAGERTTARINIPAGASTAMETNLMEQAVGYSKARLSTSGAHVDIDVGPYSINTLRIDYPKLGEEFWRGQEQGSERTIP
jgi:alpha-mannosidase